MDVEKLFHMAGGTGPTSYAQNSSLQKKASDTVKHLTLEALQQVYVDTNPKTINIADLGCSCGPNTLEIIKDFIREVEVTSREILHNPDHQPEFQICLNDLPTNDFNSVFKALPEFHMQLRNERGSGQGSPSSVYIGGYPGSFYGRLFPTNSLHFIHSSNCLHWLSKVPPTLYNEKGESINKGNVYISESSPQAVSRAYFKQFEEDFTTFLRSRSVELVVGGRMVVILLGRTGPDHFDRGNSFFWELLSRSLAILVSQGQIQKEKVDTYHAHFYAPSKEEIEDEVGREGSLKLDQLNMYHIEREGHDHNGESYGSAVARTVRAIQQSTIVHHFGVQEGDRILDSLFEIYGRMVDEEMAKEEIKSLTFVLLLRKL